MSKQVQINVTYPGGHNFDLDMQLEQMAGRARCDAGMDFDSMKRLISFEFADDIAAEVQKSEMFIATVRSTFPDFIIGVAP